MARDFLEYCICSGGGSDRENPAGFVSDITSFVNLKNPFNAKAASTALASFTKKGFFKNEKLMISDTNPAGISQISGPVFFAW